jgi:hypothetical protein
VYPASAAATLRLTFDAFWKQINAEIEEAHATKAPAKRPDSEVIEELSELARRQDIANQLLVSRTELIDLRLEQQRDASPITSAGAYNTLYGQPVRSLFVKPFSALEALSSLSRAILIFTEDGKMVLPLSPPNSNVPRTAAAAAHRDIEHDTDDKNE